MSRCKLQVPVLGMEHNPESLIARSETMAWFYGYDRSDHEAECEILGHVPSPHPSALSAAQLMAEELAELARTASPDAKVRLRFRSEIVPWAACGIHVPVREALAHVVELSRGGLYTLESFK